MDNPDTYPKVTALSPRIIEIDFGPHAEVTLEFMQRALQRHQALNLKGKQGVLIMGHDLVRGDEEAKRFVGSREVCDVTAATAIVVESLPARHLIRLFHWFNPPPYPSRPFANREDALAWLERMVEIRARA